MKSRGISLGLSFVMIGLPGVIAGAADLHVPADYPTIQAAISAAQAGDTILVADGTYTGTGNKWISFGGGPTSFPLTLKSENGPANCTIDCQNSGVAFFLVADEPETLLIEGFTIVNGNNSHGGAFFCHHGGRPIVRNCVMSQHQGGSGAVFCENTASPTFLGCTFSGNTGAGGGAVKITGGAAPKFINCTLRDNSSTFDGGAVFTSNFGATVVPFINCVITGNDAAGAGGGIMASGGGTVSLINCTVADNESLGQGGGLHVRGPNTTTIVNSILWGNAAPAGEQLALETSGETSGATVNIAHSILQGGAAGVFIEGGSTLNYAVSNLESNPNFLNPAGQDYSLAYPSPAMDAGDLSALPADDLDLDNDGNVLEPLPVDRGNQPRVAGCSVDLGAFEFQSGLPGSGDFDGGGLSFSDVGPFVQALLEPGADACIADVNGDGEIDGLDISAFTAALLD